MWCVANPVRSMASPGRPATPSHGRVTTTQTLVYFIKNILILKTFIKHNWQHLILFILIFTIMRLSLGSLLKPSRKIVIMITQPFCEKLHDLQEK